LTTDYDGEGYERRLFSSERLNHKFEEFENITIPSVTGQTRGDWEWLIYTSNQLPKRYMRRLESHAAAINRIKVIAVPNFMVFFKLHANYEYEKSYATVRLDDDDGLSELFVEKLQGYSDRVGSIICFTEGRLVKYSNGRVLKGERISEKNNAQGLAAIGLKIYSCGRHSDIDKRYNVVYDASPEMFLLTCSQYTDTKRAFSWPGRQLQRLKRLIFLAGHQPSAIPGEVGEFVKKRLRR